MTDLPEPMTTADMTIIELDSFMLNTEQLLRSELWAISTGDEFKAAMGLWCRAWKQIPAGSLPDDEKILAGFSGAGTKWKKVREIALRGFVKCSDGRLYHKTLCEDVTRAWKSKVERHKRTEAAAAARRNGGNVNRHDVRDVNRHDVRDGNRDDAPTIDVTGSHRQGQGHRHVNISLTSPPPGDPSREDNTTTTTATFTRIHGIDIPVVQKAIATGAFISLVKALGGNTGKDREAEWKREADGLTLFHVAAIFGWRATLKSPIREPSGFRQARQAWDALTAKQRSEIGHAELDSMGIDVRKTGEA